MKALFINHAGVLGGASVSMMDILNAIVRNGDTVEVVNADKPQSTVDLLRHRGFTVHTVSSVMSLAHYNGGVTNPFSLPALSNLRQVLKSAKRIEALIAASDCDTVLVNSMTLFYVGKIAKKYGKRTVCFQRETFPKGWRSRRIRAEMARYFDAVVFISQYDKQQFDAYDSLKKYVVYDKIDIEKFAVSHQTMSHNTVLFLGGFSHLKGTLTAIKTIERMPDSRLLIVGKSNGVKRLKDAGGMMAKLRILFRTDYENRCWRYIHRHRLMDRVQVLSPTAEIEALYAQANVVLFCPNKPHQSRLIYETAACGIPIVIADYENTREFEYDHVLTYRRGNVENCVKQLYRAFTTEIDVETLKHCVEKKHDVKTLSSELKCLLAEVNVL